eukprot:CAMPEP_0169402370 /NCGR_PEP_ID=MMETSP1017-20121227/55103_1 /TAXON_ID=342587 /ORGANISM="Karlodinium micrum, Strain CCMP2283" /LENGTH=141 /DNA_ID=CAMNT_0009508347 /DNA_START=73 /DNA_END=494 /DNA_ORIENTATION=+
MTAFGDAVKLLPFLSCFWSCWHYAVFCRRRCCPNRLRGQMFVEGEDEAMVFHLAHPLDSDRELDYALRTRRPLDSMSSLQFKMSPFDVFRVLDVGSGGFYSYFLDSPKRRITATGTEAKLKYEKGKTFVDQFLDAEHGERL